MTASPTTPRRILILVDRYFEPYGGTEGQLRMLVAHLPEGHEAEVWALRESPWLEKAPFPSAERPVPTRVLGIGSLRSPRSMRRARRAARDIRRGGFALIHTFMNDASLLAAWLSKASGVPYVVSRRDLGFWQTPRWLQVLRRANRRARGVLANCEAVRRHTVRTEHVPPGLVEVVPNGHPREAFEAPADPSLRARLGVPADARVLGFLANVKGLKRQDDLLEAFQRLAARHEDLHVWFIGEDPGTEPPDRPPLGERLRGTPFEARVRLFRAEGDVASVLKHLTVGVSCSETEGLSNAILEYLACGLPVVATRVGGNTELVRDGENGWLVDVGDVDALTERLERLLADPDAARRMGRASRARFEQRFTVERMVAATTRAYARWIEPPAREDAALRWEVVDDLQALTALAPAWQALLRPGQFFLGPDWVLSALGHAPDAGRPHVLVARTPDGALAGLLPLADVGGGVLEVAGRRFGGDHIDVVAAPERAHAVAEGALRRLAGMPWKRIALEHLAEDGALRLAVWRGDHALPWRELLATVCPYVPVSGTHAAFEREQLSSSFRRNVRRYTRRFEETPGARVERITDPAAMPAAIDRFYALHARRFDERGEASSVTDALRGFHRALAGRAALGGRAVLTFLCIDERDIACEYAFVDHGVRYAFQGGQDASAPVQSAGTVLRGLVLRDEVFAAGLSSYDLLDGDEGYKAHWTRDARRLFDVVLHRRGPAGRLARACTTGAALAKDLLRPAVPALDRAFPGRPS